MLFVHILGKEDPHAFIDLCIRPLQTASLQLIGACVVILQVGLVVEENLANGSFVSVFEECFQGQGIRLGARLPAAGHNGCVLVVPEEVEDVVCRGVVGLPGPVVPQDLLLEVPHAWLGRAQDVKLVLELGRLAAHLLMELDGLHVRVPRLAFFASRGLLVHHGELPEVAEQDDAGQLIRILPHGQDPFEVRCRQHGDLRGIQGLSLTCCAAVARRIT